jgi:flagellin
MERGKTMSMTVGLNSNIYAMLYHIANLEAERATTMERLSTGKRINHASDDPAGLIALTAFTADMARIDTAIENNERSQAVLDTADTTLMAISDLMQEIQTALVAASDPNATSEEIAAYQATVDQSLNSIDALLESAEFNGTKLFRGAYEITPTVTDANSLIGDEHVYMRDASATAATTITVQTDAASDVYITVNGNTVNFGAATLGREIQYNIDGFSGSITMTSTAANRTATIDVAASGGATFQTGTDSSTSYALDLGAGLATTELGDAIAGYLSTLRSGMANDLSSGNLTTAESIVEKASRQVAVAASRVGSFNKYQIGSSLKALQGMKEATADAISRIEDADFAEETAKLDRQNILLQAAVSMLSQANSSQALVLALLQ